MEYTGAIDIRRFYNSRFLGVMFVVVSWNGIWNEMNGELIKYKYSNQLQVFPCLYSICLLFDLGSYRSIFSCSNSSTHMPIVGVFPPHDFSFTSQLTHVSYKLVEKYRSLFHFPILLPHSSCLFTIFSIISASPKVRTPDQFCASKFVL